MTEPKILFFDIESAGVNALKSDLGFVIVFGYKWNCEKRSHVITPTRKELQQFSDKRLLIEASELFVQADLIVGHFASIFDRRFIQGRLLINGLNPIPPVKMRDTCLIARSVANFSSNRLKHLAKILNLRHQKLENGWPLAWFKVMQGDMKYLKGLADYCEGDVMALEELYMRLRPFDTPHPRIYEDRDKCGSCGGPIQYRGRAFANNLTYRRYQCLKCHKWGRDTRAIK